MILQFHCRITLLEVFMNLLDFDAALKVNPPYLIFIPFNPQKKITLITNGSDPIPTTLQSTKNNMMIPVCCFCTKSLFKRTTITFRPSIQCDAQHQNLQSDNFCCVGCFSKQVINRNKEKQQNIEYNVYAKLEYPILCGNWSVFYEFIMLDCLETFGFDWEKCEEYLRYMGASYRTEEIMNHYETYYSNPKQQQLQIDTILVNKRKQNPTITLTTQKNPYKLSLISSYSSENSSFMNSQEVAFHCYQQTAMNLIMQSQSPYLEQYIADFQFCEKTRPPATEKQLQLKYRILEEYSKQVKVRQQKKKIIVQYQQILLEPSVFQEGITKELLGVNLGSGTVKDLMDVYCDFFPDRKEGEKLFQMLGSALSISQNLMRFLSKDQFLVLTESIHFCLKIQRLCNTLEQYQEPQKKNKLKSLGFFKCLRKMKQEDEDEQKKPRKRRKLVGEKEDEATDKTTKKIITSLGFQTEEQFIKYLKQNDGKNDESAQLIIMKFNN